MTLTGPDPDLFRTKVYGARWYCDPLPADDIAEVTEDRWPAITTVKKAWSKPFRKTLPTGERVPLDAFWAAEFAVDKVDAIQALGEDRAAAVTLVATSATRTLNRAAERGDGVHTVLEELGAGKALGDILVNVATEPFLPACAALVADWNPTWVATEIVCINRTIGFGGTADAIWTIEVDGKPLNALVDYKSRGGEHGCYEEDAAQIGGYSLAEYVVVASPIDGRPMRMELPALDTGLLVSLTADSYQLYPVDLAEAQAAFLAMRSGWESHREGTKAARRARKNILLPAGGTTTTGTPAERQTLSEPPPATPSRENGDQPATGSDGGATASESEPAAGPTPDIWTPPFDEPEMRCATCDVAPGMAHITAVCVPTRDPGTPPEERALLRSRVQWLQDRVDAIKAAGHAATLARFWSEHPEVPTFPKGGPTTAAEMDVVSRICWDTEKEHRMPFPDTDDPAVVAFEAEAKAKGLV
jgi:hypothetical protein